MPASSTVDEKTAQLPIVAKPSPKVDVDLPYGFKPIKGILYFLSFSSRADLWLYFLGVVSALGCGLPFAALDLLYGHWTSALVPRDRDSTSREIIDASIFAASVMGGVTVWTWGVTGTFYWCFTLASSRTTARIRRAYLSAILAQDSVYFETTGPGEVASRMVRDIGLVQSAVGEKLGFIVWSSSSLITGVIISFWAAPVVGGVLFSILPFSAILFYLSGAFSSRASARIAKTEGAAASFLEQVVSSVRIVKVLQASDTLVGVYDKLLKDIQMDGRFVALSTGFAFSTSYFGIFCAYALAFWYGGNRVAYHGLNVGRLATSFFSSFNAMFSIVNILPHISALHNGLLAQARIRAEIERPSPIDYRDETGMTDVSTPFDQSKGPDGGLDIKLRNVHFAFPSRPNQPSLKGVSLHIPKGKVVALVGSSGSGKSTVIALLTRSYELPDPTSTTSNIFVAGQPLGSIRLSTLRSFFGVVSQDPQLFSGSILENVAVGLTGTSDELAHDGSNRARVEELCRAALQKAQAMEFTDRLPNGLDEIITGGKTGVLSGGQKQRIAVARALVRRPRVLILDEGTAALDTRTEQDLMAAIAQEQAERGMTVVLIAHRLSTVEFADKIIVMGAGEVLEEGTHSELLARGEAYANMIKLHHGYFPGEDNVSLNEETPEHKSTFMAHPHSSVILPIPIGTHARDAPPVPLARGASETSTSHELMMISSRLSARRPFSHTELDAENGVLEEPEVVSMKKRAKWAMFFRFIDTAVGWIVPGGSCSCLIGALFPLTGWLTGLTIKALSQPAADDVSRDSSRLALYFFIVAVGSLIFCMIEGWFLENGSQRIIRTMRRAVTKAVITQEVGFFEGSETGAGELTSKISADPATVSNALGMVLGRLLVSIVNFIGSCILGFILSWKLTLVSFAPLLILVPCGYLEIYFLEKFLEENEKPVANATTYAVEAVDSIKTVASFGRERRVLADFDRIQKPDRKRHARLLMCSSICFGLSQALVPLITLVVFRYGGQLLATGGITLDGLYATFEAAVIGAFSLTRMFSYVGDISGAIHAFDNLYSWLCRKPLVATIISHKPPVGSVDASEKSDASDIVFKGISLVYPSRPDKPALSNINLRIHPGERLAFCGPSGGGKSTILSVLARFYEPSQGTIFIGGEDIRETSLEDHYARIALVSQDAVLYQGTIAFNLTLGLSREVSPQELEKACEDACILDFIKSLDDGFNAQIGMKGLQLSGGQRQRLCIARALLRNAPILLLDEATSALDNESEALVQQALDRASVGRTSITIAHRLSTIRSADRIVVVEDGRLCEEGTHEQLLKKKGRYFELVEAQL